MIILFNLVLYLSIALAKSFRRNPHCGSCPIDPITRVRQLSTIYEGYRAASDLRRLRDLIDPQVRALIIDPSSQCCPTPNVFITFLSYGSECFEGPARLFRNGSVEVQSTCVYRVGQDGSDVLALKYTQLWNPAPGTCNYGLRQEIGFNIECTNVEASCKN